MEKNKKNKREMGRSDICCKQGANWKDLKEERTKAMNPPGRCAHGKGTMSMKA